MEFSEVFLALMQEEEDIEVESALTGIFLRVTVGSTGFAGSTGGGGEPLVMLVLCLAVGGIIMFEEELFLSVGLEALASVL